jgi:signal transduction histidine kinase
MDSSNIKQHDGAGLGLAIVQKLVDLHEGKIKVESKLGKGTKFIVNLPLRIKKTEE